MKKALSLLLSSFMVISLLISGVTVSAAEKIKVACVGDSITEGFTSSNTSINSYPAQLQIMMGDGYEFKNYGLGGRTAGKETSSPYWNEGYYTESLNYNPDIVIIMLGTNDAAANNQDKLDTYEENMTALVESYINLPSNPTVYLCTAPKCGDQTERANNVPNVIIPAQKRIAENLGVNLVNTYEWSVENYEHFPDALHPNDTGYCLMAQFFYEEIFGKTLYDMTVKGEEGSVCSSYGQSYTLDSTGEISFKIHEGTHEISLKKAGFDRLNITVNVPTDSLADFTQLGFVQNLALNGTAFDQGQYEYYAADRGPQMLNDGDINSSWQLSGGDYYNGGTLTGIYVGIEFDEPTAFDRVVLTWELGSRCTEDGYRLEYSNDGENYESISFEQTIINENEDTLTFDGVTAKYLRILLLKGKNSKYTPRLFELEVYCDNNGGTVTPPDDDPPAYENYIKFIEGSNYYVPLYASLLVRGVAADTTVSEFKANVLNKNIQISLDTVDNPLSDDDLVGTGLWVHFPRYDEDGNVVDIALVAYHIIIDGDVNGDGKVNSTDFMQVRKAYLGLYNFDYYTELAADTNGDGDINSTDFMQIRRHFLELYNLYE